MEGVGRIELIQILDENVFSVSKTKALSNFKRIREMKGRKC